MLRRNVEMKKMKRKAGRSSGLVFGKSFVIAVLAFVLSFSFVFPAPAEDPPEGKTVRVGWYD